LHQRLTSDGTYEQWYRCLAAKRVMCSQQTNLLSGNIDSPFQRKEVVPRRRAESSWLTERSVDTSLYTRRPLTLSNDADGAEQPRDSSLSSWPPINDRIALSHVETLAHVF